MDSKTKKLIALFSVSSFVLGAGCGAATTGDDTNNNSMYDDPTYSSNTSTVTGGVSSANADITCLDEDGDNYCDGDHTLIEDDDNFIFVNVGGYSQKRYFKKGYAPVAGSTIHPTAKANPPAPKTNGSIKPSGSSSTTTKPSSTVKPPTSSRGTGTVVNKSSGSSSTKITSGRSSSRGGIGSSGFSSSS
ncbi:MAG TPA: hypothetical protein VFV52_16785 [Bacilli bacterium]|nr:hypothetical protein [Bacilli bacterium]